MTMYFKMMMSKQLTTQLIFSMQKRPDVSSAWTFESVAQMEKSKKPKLSETHPDIAAQAVDWDPSTVTAGSGVRKLWECSLGHQWEAVVNDRTFGYGCPYCAGQKVLVGYNDLATNNPELASQADGWDPTTVTAGSKRKLSWRCSLGHKWEATVKNRNLLKSTCPVCNGNQVLAGFNDLATINPALATQAHGWDPTTITAGSGLKRTWECTQGHIWETSVHARSSNSRGCPFCTGQKVLVGYNDFATHHPELASQADGWDPTSVTFGSKKRLRWKCELGHTWQAAVKDRKKAGCPICAGNEVLAGFNDLATTNPELAKEWHPTKNHPLLATELTAGSQKLVWWLGLDCAHEWRTSPGSRKGCPICSGNQVLAGFNDLATVNPELAKEWHPTKNKGKSPSQVMWGSPSKVWWLCNKAQHEWQASIASRNNGTGCSSCAAFGFNPSLPAWLYFLEHENWDLFQIGITNNRDQRTGLHLSRKWTLVDLRGPIDGVHCKSLEQSILTTLRKRGAVFAHTTDVKKFDGWTESWTRSSMHANTIVELMEMMYQDD